MLEMLNVLYREMRTWNGQLSEIVQGISGEFGKQNRYTTGVLI